MCACVCGVCGVCACVRGDTGLNHNSVQRLKGLWERVSEKAREQWSEMDVLMSPQHNFRHYRRELKKRKAPVLPYFGIYLRDFTFINDGNQQYKPDGALTARVHTAHTHTHTQHSTHTHTAHTHTHTHTAHTHTHTHTHTHSTHTHTHTHAHAKRWMRCRLDQRQVRASAV